MSVVHDLVEDVDGRRKERERALDNINGAHDAGAEPPRFRQNDSTNRHTIPSSPGEAFKRIAHRARRQHEAERERADA